MSKFPRIIVAAGIAVIALASAGAAPLRAQTPIPTDTPSPTATDTGTPTATVTVTPSNTPTSTVTPSPLATNTPTPTATVGTTPQPPTLTSPADGTTLFDLQPVLQWQAAAGAMFYTVQVSTTSDFSAVSNTGSPIFSTQYQVSSALPPGLYYWRVGTWTGATTLYSSYRSMILFQPTPSNTPTATATGTPNLTATAVSSILTTTAQAQATSTATAFPSPALVSPADGASTNSPLSLLWSAVSGADWYKAQVATDPVFADLVIDSWVQSPNTSLAVTLSTGTYYWRAGAWSGSALSFSGGRTLIIATALPTSTLTATITPTFTASPTATASPSALASSTAVLTATGNPLIDVFEDDNTPDKARQIVIGEAQLRTFYSPAGKDEDWAFVILKPGAWQISAYTDTGSYDPALTIYFNGKPIAKGDDEDGKNALVRLQVTGESSSYTIKAENIGVDGKGFYTLAVQKVEFSPPSVSVARAPTARPASRLEIHLYVDLNANSLMDVGEEINSVVVIASATGWREQAVTTSGAVIFALPAFSSSEEKVLIQIPYLHRAAELSIPQSGGAIRSDVILPAPSFPLFLP